MIRAGWKPALRAVVTRFAMSTTDRQNVEEFDPTLGRKKKEGNP